MGSVVKWHCGSKWIAAVRELQTYQDQRKERYELPECRQMPFPAFARDYAQSRRAGPNSIRGADGV